MCNSIFISEKTIPKAEDGEEFTVTVKGVYHTDEDGTRKLDVLSVDGKEVVGPEEEKSDCGCGEDHEMNSDDALEIFMIQNKKNKG